MKQNIIIIVTISLYIIFIKNSSIVNTSIIEACTLFFYKIFPSLFPMLILSQFIIEYNILNKFNIFFFKINKKFFNINIYCSILFLTSIFIGNPGNAKIAKYFYKNNKISELNIQKVLLFSHFCNPMFINVFAKDKFILVTTCHYLSNFIIGIILKNKYVDNKIIFNREKTDNKKFLNIFFESINSTISTLLFILGTIVSFYVFLSIININYLSPIIEISQGMNYINNLNINLKLKTILFGGALSFGGLCIHMQIFGILSELKIKYFPYFVSRIIHSIFTMILITLFY